MYVDENWPPAMNSVGVKVAATLLVFVGNKEYTSFHFHVIYQMTKCNKTNKLKQCHKYKGSDREACISYYKYQTGNK